MDRDARVALKPPLARQPFAIEEHIIAAHQGIYFMNKPAGWPTSGRTLDDEACVQFQLMQHTRKKIWAVHQLDADTSGVNVFTHRKSSVPYWQKRLHFPSAQKEYLALVHGRVDQPLTITAPIGRKADGSWGVTANGKSARTQIIPVHANDEFSLLRIQLRTGRTHQIRVHLEHVGHSLVGEFWYNHAPCLLADRHMLHAWRTTFDDRDDIAGVVAPLPEDLRACAQKIGISIPDIIDGESPFQPRFRLRKQG